MSATLLAPITRQFSHTIFRGGRTRRECWNATTLDGTWGFDRLELPGTPWEITYVPLRVTVGLAGTLKSARQIAAGMTTRDVVEYRLELAEESDRSRRAS
jgi:hypothetical protein